MPSIIQFFIGFIVGAAVVGSSVQRTISVERGEIKMAIFMSLLNSVSYFYSIYAVANDQYITFLGTATGSTILMGLMACRNKK